VEIEVEWETERFVLLRREIDNPALRCPEFENVTRACELMLKEENAGDGTLTEPGTGTTVGSGVVRDGDC
jgi:hypothetical protein